MIIEQSENKKVYFLDKSFSLNINFDFSNNKTILDMPFSNLNLEFNPLITFKNLSTEDSIKILPQEVNNEFIYTNNYIYAQNLPNKKYDLIKNSLGRSSIMMKSTESLSLYQLAISDISYKDTNQSTIVLKYIINLSDEDVYKKFSNLILDGYSTINYSIAISLR